MSEWRVAARQLFWWWFIPSAAAAICAVIFAVIFSVNFFQDVETNSAEEVVVTITETTYVPPPTPLSTLPPLPTPTLATPTIPTPTTVPTPTPEPVIETPPEPEPEPEPATTIEDEPTESLAVEISDEPEEVLAEDVATEEPSEDPVDPPAMANAGGGFTYDYSNPISSSDQPNVTAAKNFVFDRWPQIDTIYTFGPGSVPNSDHPRGLALDIMTSDVGLGNEIAAWFRNNPDVFGTSYVLWQVRDHYDHVHVSLTGGWSEVQVEAVDSEPAPAAASNTDARFVELINEARAVAGVAPVQAAAGLTDLSLFWSKQQLAAGRMHHNPNGFAMLSDYGAASARWWAENVARWTADAFTVDRIFQGYMDSPGHRANILNANARFVGVGTVCEALCFNTMTFTDRVD